MSNDIKRRLILEGDSSSAERALGKARKAQDRLNSAVLENIKAMRSTVNNNRAASAALARLSAAFDDARISSEIATDRMKGDLAGVQARAERAAGAVGRVGKNVNFGRIGSAGSALSGALGSVGISGDAANAIGQLSSGVDAVQQLGGAVSGLAVAGPIAGVGLAAVSAALNEAAKAAEKASQKEQRRLDTTLKVEDAILDGLSESDAQEIIRRQRAIADIRIKALEAERAAQVEAFESVNRAGDALVGPAGLAFKLAAFASGQGGFQYTENLEDLQAQIDESSRTAEAYEKALKDGRFAADETATAETGLSAARETASAAIASLNEQYLKATEDFLDAATKTAAARKLQDDRSGEDRALREKRAEEDLQRALEDQQKQHKDNLLDITKRADDAILAARSQLAAKEADAIERIADLRAKFAKDELRVTQDFNRARERAEQDFRRRLKAIQKNFEDDRFNAILGNDVRALIEAQRTRKTAKQAEKEDFGIEDERAREDFETERQRRQEALDERIADINAELEKYRESTAAKIAEIEREKEADIAAAQAAFDEQLAKDKELRDITKAREEEDFKIRQDRLTEDRRLEDERRQEAFDKTIERLDAAKNAELDKINETETASVGFWNSTQSAISTASGGLANLAAQAERLARAGGASGPAPRTITPSRNIAPTAPPLPSGATTPAGVSGASGDSANITVNPVQIMDQVYVPYSEFQAAMEASATDKQKLLQALRTKTPR